MKILFIIGLGGALGSIGRYLVQMALGRYVTLTFPLGTLVVNITGCFLIGLLYGLAERHAWMSIEWRLFLITGICGGYTTFSTYSYESITLLKHGNYSYLIFYITSSVIFGLLATLGGMLAVR
ncbi:MAG TPA: fluoride efflux transporter CrcB [Puia sp.]|uniref:fluoride efflux transporter CrcB n=1 Tax=Puia sp. TaxID=2045100 RepID=UPI002CA955D7|nr:fluoride efflux transporter CrcB [Puia sp.]HVU99327.1 fluoride efflux transporter CrcB [Puia sp.]